MCSWRQYGDDVEFVWRLARAYKDMCETTDGREEKKNYAEQGETDVWSDDIESAQLGVHYVYILFFK